MRVMASYQLAKPAKGKNSQKEAKRREKKFHPRGNSKVTFKENVSVAPKNHDKGGEAKN